MILSERSSGPTLLISNPEGDLYDVPGIEPAAMSAGHYFRLKRSDIVRLHPDSDILMLPSRAPVGFDPAAEKFISFDRNPVSCEKERCYAAAAFLAPGYTGLCSAAYGTVGAGENKEPLPLFSYAPVFLYKGEICSAAIRTDREKRQQFTPHDLEGLEKKVRCITGLFPGNRLIGQLEKCALEYCCPAGRNFFLGRYEAPLPASPRCNSFCRGCISFQPKGEISVTQPRIDFIPSPREIADTALYHISSAKDPVVSFGQGCEGEPLMVERTLVEAVKMIRKETSKGMINLNTNASVPGAILRLFDAGLDSIRVSMNSAREKYYLSYYRPRGYSFKDVKTSIKNAKKRGGFVSLNYLVMPGFTDSRDEIEAFFGLLGEMKIDMIQWRNLNYDPVRYFREMGAHPSPLEIFGIKDLIRRVKKEFPQIMHGYYNPSKGRIERHIRSLVRRS